MRNEFTSIIERGVDWYNVESILEELAAGTPLEQRLVAHPRQTREAVSARLAFAAQALMGDVVYPLPRRSA